MLPTQYDNFKNYRYIYSNSIKDDIPHDIALNLIDKLELCLRRAFDKVKQMDSYYNEEEDSGLANKMAELYIILYNGLSGKDIVCD